MLFTNISSGPKGLNTTTATVFVQSGQTVTVDVYQREQAGIVASGWWDYSGSFTANPSTDDGDDGGDGGDDSDEGLVWVDGVYDGVTPIDDAIAAAVAAVEHGGEVRMRHGSARLNSRQILSHPTKSFTFNFRKTDLILTHYDDGLVFDAGWSVIKAFSTISADGLTLGGIDDTSLFRDQEIVRLISNVAAPDAYDDSAYQAEDLFMERKATANSLLLARPTGSITGAYIDWLLNTPRVCQRSGHKVDIIGGTIRHEEGTEVGSFASECMIELWAATYPHIQYVECPRAFCPTIETKACLWPTTDDTVHGRHDDYSFGTDTESRGYGIRDSSYGGLIRRAVGYRGRHLTDTHEQAYGNSSNNPSFYGTSVGLRVEDCVADGFTQDAFSFHHGCRDAKISNCTASNYYEYGIGIRGEVTVDGFHAYNGRYGAWHVMDQGGATPSRTKARIRGVRSYNCGPSRNENHVTPVYVSDEENLNMIWTNTCWLSQNFADGVVIYDGNLRIQLGYNRPSTAFGNTVLGTIIFDTVDLDATKAGSAFVDMFDVRGPGAPVSTYNLWGNLMRVRGASIRTMFRVDGSFPVSSDQLRFNLLFESPAAALVTGASGVALATVQGITNGTLTVVTEAGTYTASAINLSGAASLAAAAAAIQAAFTTPGFTVTHNGTGFVVTSNAATVNSSVSITTTAMATTLKLTAATSAVSSGMWTTTAQSNQTHIQLCTNNNMAGLSGVTVINPADQFRGIKARTETLNLTFSQAAANGAIITSVATVNGLKSGDLATITAACNDTTLEMMGGKVTADHTVTVYARYIDSGINVTPTDVPIKLAISR
jgi:hypothetical protein